MNTTTAREAAETMTRDLRNRLQTWKHHPSYDTKSHLLVAAQELLGAWKVVSIVEGTQYSFDNVEEFRAYKVAEHLASPGSDRAYREQALDLATAVVPSAV